MKTVLMVIAPEEFQDKEYEIPYKVLEENGIEVITASKNAGICHSSLGKDIEADLGIDEVGVGEFDAIVLVGGSGARVYLEDEILHDIIRGFEEEDKIVAAICIAPAILAKSGVLEGKNATVFPKHAHYLEENGANYTKKNVEIDGNIITANGPQAAKEFGEAISNKLREE
jgi:protease I